MRLMPRLLDSRGRLPPPPPLRAKPARAGCCAPPARERLSSSSASSSSSSIASSAAPSSSSSPSRSPVSLAELSARLLRRPGTLALPFFCACAWSTLERRADLRPARDASAYSRGSLRILANAPFLRESTSCSSSSFSSSSPSLSDPPLVAVRRPALGLVRTVLPPNEPDGRRPAAREGEIDSARERSASSSSRRRSRSSLRRTRSPRSSRSAERGPVGVSTGCACGERRRRRRGTHPCRRRTR